ncbi:MAG: hypothetical protein NTW07_01765, partial [candidate division Zixibacteria bacterium]|nr:hypothetical protein [candidate division Zixibacteria bacterium]
MSSTRLNLLAILRSYGRFGFHVSRKSWDWLELPELAVSPPSEKPAIEVFQLRRLADRVNERRPESIQLTGAIHGGELASVSFIVDVFRYIIEIYCQEEQPGVIRR